MTILTLDGRCVRSVGVLLLASGVVSPAAGGTETVYRYDDGVSNVNVGPPSSFGTDPADMLFGNVFEATPGATTITRVEVEIGTLVEGTPMFVGVYEDPNDDGVLDDLVLLRSVNAIPVETSFGEANVYDIAPVEVTGSFFVAAIVAALPGIDRPARLDPDGTGAFSWLMYSPDMDTGDPLGSSLFATTMDNPQFVPIFGAFAVRAVAVPAPGAVVVFALGALVAGRRRG